MGSHTVPLLHMERINFRTVAGVRNECMMRQNPPNCRAEGPALYGGQKNRTGLGFCNPLLNRVPRVSRSSISLRKVPKLPVLEAFAEQRELTLAKCYEVTESGWKGAQQKHLSEVYADAKSGRFNVLLI